MEPEGLLAVLVNEVARRQLKGYAEPGGRWKRFNVPFIEWYGWKISSGFRVKRVPEEDGGEGGLGAGGGGQSWAPKVRGRLGLDIIYVEFSWRF